MPEQQLGCDRAFPGREYLVLCFPAPFGHRGWLSFDRPMIQYTGRQSIDR